jgi:hypothetical protein
MRFNLFYLFIFFVFFINGSYANSSACGTTSMAESLGQLTERVRPKITIKKNPAGMRIAGKHYISGVHANMSLKIPDAVTLTHSLAHQLPPTMFGANKINDIIILDDIKDVSRFAKSSTGKVNRYSGKNIVIDEENGVHRIYINKKDIAKDFSLAKLDLEHFGKVEHQAPHKLPIAEPKTIGNLVPEEPSVFSGGLISLSAEPPEGFFAAATTAELKQAGLKIKEAHKADVMVYRVPDSRQESYFKFQFASADRPIDSALDGKFKVATGIGPSSNPASIGGREADLLIMGDEQQGVLTSYLSAIGKKDLKITDLYEHPGIVQKISDKEVFIGNIDQARRLTSEGFNDLKTDPMIYRNVYSKDYDKYLRSLFEKETGPAPKDSYLLGTSRGCTQGCTICCSGGLEAFQFFDAPRMMEEVEKLSKHASLKPGEMLDVFFVDSNFNNAPKRLIEFAELYKKSPHYKQHRFFVRHNTLNGFLKPGKDGAKVPNVELLKAYKDLGITEIFMGIDTFDDASTITLKTNRLKIAKQETAARPTYTYNETAELIAAMEKEGLTSKGFLLTNNPWVSDLDRLDSYYNLTDLWLKNPHFSIDSARDRAVLQLKPFDGSPITNVSDKMGSPFVKDNRFVAEGAFGEIDEMMNFEKMGVPRSRGDADGMLEDFHDGINKIRTKAESILKDPKISDADKKSAKLVIQKIISREGEMKALFETEAKNGSKQAGIYLKEIEAFRGKHSDLPTFNPQNQLDAFKDKSKSLFDGLKDEDIHVKKPTPANTEVGYDSEIKDLSSKAAHTIHNVPAYLTDNLGLEIVQRAAKDNSKIIISMGEGNSALSRVEKAGWKVGAQVEKREGFHQIYHAVSPEGEKGFIITRVNGEDRKVHIQSLLKLADVPESQVLTFGKTKNWKDDYLAHFKQMGYVPDGVIYGFQKTAITGAIKANPVLSFPTLIKQAIIDRGNRKSIRNLDHNDLAALPMSVLEFKNGKRYWFFKNVYGDLADQLFHALEDHGVKNFLYSGTAGSLNPAHEVGNVFTPKRYLNKEGKVEEINWLKPVKGIKTDGQYTRVSTPNIETKQWLKNQQAKGTDIIEVELGYFLDRFKNKEDVNSRVILTISDVLEGPNSRDLTQWNKANKDKSISPIKLAMDDFMQFKKDSDYRIKKYQSLQIKPQVKE